MNIVCASDNISVDENSVFDDDANLALPQDNDDNLVLEKTEPLTVADENSNDNSLSVTNDDVLNARQHLTVKLECLNNQTTFYNGDIFHYKVNITNDGETNFTEQSLYFEFSNYLGFPTFVGWSNDDGFWDISKSSFTEDLEGKNIKPFNVGDTSIIYVDLVRNRTIGNASVSAEVVTYRPFQRFQDRTYNYISRPTFEFKKEIVKIFL